MSEILSPATRAAAICTAAARVAAGTLWLHEGMVKYQSRFGAADIALVINSATSNSRVPRYFKWLASDVMRPLTGFFGCATPLLETLLGALLVLGVLPRWASAASIAALMLYWSADQLITQYPVMAALSAIVLLPAAPASPWGALARVRRLFDRRSSCPTTSSTREGDPL